MTFRRAGVVWPRGLTFIEILIAVAILVAVGAIVAPNVLSQLDQRTFEAAVDRASGHLLLARSHAQQTGRAVEVAYHHDPPRLVARYFDAAGEGRALEQNSSSRRNAEFGTQNSVANSREIARSWAVRTLPEPVVLSRERPDFLEPESVGPDDAAGDFTDTVPDFLTRTERVERDQPVRLAVFLNDGTAVFTREIWITDGRERAALLRLNTWTGETVVNRPGRVNGTSDAEHDIENAGGRQR